MSLTEIFEDLYGKDPGKDADGTQTAYYSTPGPARHLCFILPDGDRLFLNYAYLVAGAYAPKESTITLAYTTHRVTLKGHNLETLYKRLMIQDVQQIACADERYTQVNDQDDAPVVVAIIVQGQE